MNKIKGGRPRKIPQIWNQKLKKDILSDYKQGKSNTHAMNRMGIMNETFYKVINMGKKNKEDLEPEELEFTETIKQGNQLSLEWWENLGLKGVQGSEQFNNGAFVFQVKNRFRKGGYDGSWTNDQGLVSVGSNNDKVAVNFNLTTEDK